jgi:uncharacterized cupredoxin-like copper-binding protein
MAAPEEEEPRRRHRLPPTDSDLSHIGWTQIGTAINTLIGVLALGIGSVALGEALSNQDHAGTQIVTVPAAKSPVNAPAANPNGPVQAKLGDGAGGPPNAGSMWIGLSRATTVAHGKVTFNVTNVGSITHEFVVISTDRPANGLGTGQRVPENGNVGETGDVPVGQRKSVSLKLKPGHYALICNIPGHYSAGMHTDFTVR